MIGQRHKGKAMLCRWSLYACIILAWNTQLQAQVLRVRDDPGGLILPRYQEIARLISQRYRVELSGQCNSTCTLYLAVPSVCVDPAGQFGFHGPSHYGAALKQDDFEYWSQLMADHYREPLRKWFLEKGRYLTQGYYRMSGADLIKIGYQSC